MELYDLAVIGATFTGVGAAGACKGKSIVIERRQQIGYEFLNSYNYGTNWLSSAKTDMGQKLKEEFFQRGILSDNGLVHLPALAPVIYNYVIECGFEILLMTDVIKIEKIGAIYEITIYNVSGFKKIRASKILDTIEGEIRITDKYINAMLCSTVKEECRLNSPNATVVKGLFSGEYILKYKVDNNDGWITAREKLHSFWRDRADSLAPWTISSIADCFEIKAERVSGVIDDNRYYIFSAAFENSLQAFEEGVLFFETEGLIL